MLTIPACNAQRWHQCQLNAHKFRTVISFFGQRWYQCQHCCHRHAISEKACYASTVLISVSWGGQICYQCRSLLLDMVSIISLLHTRSRISFLAYCCPEMVSVSACCFMTCYQCQKIFGQRFYQILSWLALRLYQCLLVAQRWYQVFSLLAQRCYQCQLPLQSFHPPAHPE